MPSVRMTRALIRQATDQGLARQTTDERLIGQFSTDRYVIMPGQATYEKIYAEENANLTFWESPLGDLSHWNERDRMGLNRLDSA